MRLLLASFALAALLALATLGAAMPALADSVAGSCSGGREICESVCTPARAAMYYGGSVNRCTSSCGPRWQQCLRNGIWVHLEDEYPGWHERVGRY